MTDSADILFPSMASATKPETQPQTLLGEPSTTETPDAPRPSTDKELMLGLYDPEGHYREPLKAALTELSDLGAPPETLNALRQDASGLFAKLELSTNEAERIADLVVQHGYTTDDDQSEAWAIDARRELRERYGDDVPKRLAQVRELMQHYPQFASLLEATKLGNHPDLVALLTERAPRLLGQMR